MIHFLRSDHVLLETRGDHVLLKLANEFDELCLFVSSLVVLHHTAHLGHLLSGWDDRHFAAQPRKILDRPKDPERGMG